MLAFMLLAAASTAWVPADPLDPLHRICSVGVLVGVIGLVTYALAILGFVLGATRQQFLVLRKNTGHCRACGYSRRGLDPDAHCPECDADATGRAPDECPVCGYWRAAVAPAGNCPECGAPPRPPASAAHTPPANA